MKCRLLIIEDDLALAALLEEYLSAFDYEIEVINDGSQAIDLLSKQQFDMVLSDIMLPGADGMTILETVGGDPARTIFVLMTGYSGIEDALSVVKKGAYDFVSKPFQLPEIKVRLDNAAGYQRLLRQQQQAAGDGQYERPSQKPGKAAVKIYSYLQASGR